MTKTDAAAVYTMVGALNSLVIAIPTLAPQFGVTIPPWLGLSLAVFGAVFTAVTMRLPSLIGPDPMPARGEHAVD